VDYIRYSYYFTIVLTGWSMSWNIAGVKQERIKKSKTFCILLSCVSRISWLTCRMCPSNASVARARETTGTRRMSLQKNAPSQLLWRTFSLVSPTEGPALSLATGWACHSFTVPLLVQGASLGSPPAARLTKVPISVACAARAHGKWWRWVRWARFAVWETFTTMVLLLCFSSFWEWWSSTIWGADKTRKTWLADKGLILIN